MNPERLIERYAEAALPAFKGDPEAVKELAELFEKQPLLLSFMRAPMISEQKKQKILELGFGKTPEIKAFLLLLMQQSRLALLPAILARCQEKLEGAKALVTVAEKLDSTTENKLVTELKNAYGVIPYALKIDPRLIGGFTLLLNNRLLDASIKGSLSRIKKQLERGTCA